MASYFGMPNHGNSFVKTKWQEKCPLKRMPSFKTVSEHCKCLVVDAQLPRHELLETGQIWFWEASRQHWFCMQLLLYFDLTFTMSYAKEGSSNEILGEQALQFCPHWFAVFCMATLRVIKGAPNCKIIIAICPATGMIFPGTSSGYGLCTPFLQLRPWVITKNWKSLNWIEISMSLFHVIKICDI